MPLRPQPWLAPLSWVYGAVLAQRNRRFEARAARRLPVPVVSVGNLAAGGTGKTPFVIWLVDHLRRAGMRPGVLARGYVRRSGEPLNDEGRLLARRFADLPQEQDPDRFAAGQRLLARAACDVLLLDDGFQHRRLHRDVDLCLLDACDPFAGGRLLPAGWLREGPGALARASAAVLTGAQRLAADERARSVALVRRYLPEGRPVHVTELRASRCEEWPEGTARPAREALAGRRVVVVAGIARPERVVAGARELGAEIVGVHFAGDHRRVAAARLAALAQEARAQDAILLWTEKDEARHDFAAGEGPARLVLCADVMFTNEEPEADAFVPFPFARRRDGS